MGPLLLLAALAGPPPDLEAVGIVLSRRNESCVAILRAEGRQRVVGLGESAFGGRVIGIAPGRVTLDFGGQRVDVRLAGVSATSAPSPPPPTAVAGAAEDPETPARTMERREMERRLGQEVPRILAETTLVPVTEAGQVAGFTLTRLPEGTLLSDAGLRPGDVLTSINDVPIDSVATLIGLWPRLQTESDIRAVVLRNGRPVALTVHLR
jgi:general secretion pathway protein C